ncbi:hypothetical protein AXK11_08100 [Cephaloticoccus primus]|uniref:Uncharacterized protein n=1 Tax=Cephaloticoccus primus TaxID=1548207 RepID=A0A139SJK4_9BACT|nr:DUF4198 domain-containing protein [Cephaloticoccus primus]KXU34680.1 hypothetical protein AXK11_08100 [Cephaloticoccus primus]
MTLRKNRPSRPALSSRHTRPSRRRQLGLALAAALLLPLGLAQSAQAARPWILPSQTVLGPASPWVSFEAASSNNLFNPNGRSIPVENIAVTGPDGQPRELANPFNGRLRSGFELELKEHGTYRIEQVPAAPAPAAATAGGTGSAAPRPPAQPTFFGSYRGENGQMTRWRGTAEELKAIADKPELTLREFGRRRLVTFVTLGQPSDTVLAPEGTALELGFERTHPNDLYADEPATFRVLLDGKPLPEAKVTVVREGDRYRDEEGAIELQSDAQGWVTIEWPGTGRYLVQAAASQKGSLHGVPSTKSFSYIAILEVL